MTGYVYEQYASEYTYTGQARLTMTHKNPASTMQTNNPDCTQTVERDSAEMLKETAAKSIQRQTKI